MLRIDPLRSEMMRYSPDQGRRAYRESSMLDIVMLLLGFGFFAAAVGYTYACERL